MSKHFEDGKYDDDLTIGLDDFNSDDLFSQVDLLKFKPSGSPLKKLKSLVLSLDWEISDDILRQFNEELIALREKWTDEKVYLVYIQILEIVSKYIYQEKSSANPNAIRLLPAFYYNFDKIVLDENLTDREIQEILFADVKRFNNLKKQIFKKLAGAVVTVKKEKSYHRLKTLVLNIDHDFTEADLGELRKEVLALENSNKASRSKVTLLQGIGTLATYVRQQGAHAHGDAFTLLHDFYAALEKITTSKMSPEQEKKNLVAEVEKFNDFKKMISSPFSPGAVNDDELEVVNTPDELSSDTAHVHPAFADIEDNSARGVQEEQADLEYDAENRLDDIFNDESSAKTQLQRDKERALLGVDVETEADDESEEDILPTLGNGIAPALTGYDEEPSSSFLDDGDNGSPLPALAGFGEEAVVDSDEAFEGQLALDNTLDAFFEDFGDTGGEDRSGTDFGDAEPIVTPESGEQATLLKQYFDEDVEIDQGLSVPSVGLGELPAETLPGMAESSVSLTNDSVGTIDYFVNLRTSIKSLGIGIETKSVNDVFENINQLRQSVNTTILERSFLQLLTTVVQYIDGNRNSSSAVAYDLVLSVFGGLEILYSVSTEDGTQLLFVETGKVLQWQQNLIHAAQQSTPTEGSGEEVSPATVVGIRSELEIIRETFKNEISQLRSEFLELQ